MYPCAHQGAFNPRISNFCNDFASICTRDAAPSHGGSRRGHETRGPSAHRLVEQRGCPLVVSVTLVQDVLQELSMKGESDFEFLNVPVELSLQVWETKTEKQRNTT